MNLSSIKRPDVPLHVEVASMLRHQILSGVLAAGAQLPPLRALSEEMGVARMTIRQAMDRLEDEGLIERFSGKGTFVKKVALPLRQTLNMKAKLSALQSMVEQLEVVLSVSDSDIRRTQIGGRWFQHMRRIHALHGEPFCIAHVNLDHELYQKAPGRFSTEIAVSVLKDLDVFVAKARQRVTITYADVEIAEALNITVNSPVFQVYREFFNRDGRLIYSASLMYPGDRLEFNIEFSV